jgi:2-dehydro-3-deoxy-D-gluconate 5-dehydrogenase
VRAGGLRTLESGFMDLDLYGRVAIVTGASRGLGRAITAALAREGVRVIGVARDAALLADLEREGNGSIRAVCCDVTNQAEVARLPERAIGAFGRLDILVNGVGGMLRGPFADQSTEILEWHLSVNVISAATLTQATGEHFIAQRAGKVINLASTASIRGIPGMVHYCTAKGALLQLTRALAVEWAPLGIQVNAIGAGGYATEMQPAELQLPGPALDARVKRIPDGRLGRPAEVGPLACFLASSLSDHVTGALYMTDGAESVQL